MNPIEKAQQASKTAQASGDPKDHGAAAKAHRKAAGHAFGQGDPEAGKKHAKLAAQHASKGPKQQAAGGALGAFADAFASKK